MENPAAVVITLLVWMVAAAASLVYLAIAFRIMFQLYFREKLRHTIAIMRISESELKAGRLPSDLVN